MPVLMEIDIFDAEPADMGVMDDPCPDPAVMILEDEIRRVYREYGEAVRVRRHYLGEDHKAYRDFPRVAALLRERGPAVLPVTVIDGRVMRTGTYPTYGELEPVVVREDLHLRF